MTATIDLKCCGNCFYAYHSRDMVSICVLNDQKNTVIQSDGVCNFWKADKLDHFARLKTP